jgi:L-malate glycosyltransferase
LKKILYIGNKLANRNKTSIDNLGCFLEKECFDLFYASSKQNKIFRIIDMISKTIQLRKSIDFVLIDVYSTQNFWYAFVISQICRFFNLKYIPILHGGNLPKRLSKNPKICKMIFNNAKINVAPSNYLKEAFIKEGFLNTLQISNPIEIVNYSFKNRNNFEPKLLWVRSFDEIYNPKMALHVLLELQKTHPNATLCMVGGGNENQIEECKKLANDLKLKVVFTGQLSKSEWIKLSEEYDIFINTTHFDNMPVSLIEAMALGLPIVSTNVGGISFLIENNVNGLLVNDEDVNEMINSILILIQNPEKSNLIAKKARLKASHFDWETIKKQWLKLLK